MAKSAFWRQVRALAWEKSREHFAWAYPVASGVAVWVVSVVLLGWERALGDLVPILIAGAVAVVTAVAMYCVNVSRAGAQIHEENLNNITRIESDKTTETARLIAELKIRKKDQAVTDAMLKFRERGIKLFHHKVKTTLEYDAWKNLFREFERDVSSTMRELHCSESEIHGFEHVGPVSSVHSDMDGTCTKADRNKGRLVAKLNHLGVIADRHDTTQPS